MIFWIIGKWTICELIAFKWSDPSLWYHSIYERSKLSILSRFVSGLHVFQPWSMIRHKSVKYIYTCGAHLFPTHWFIVYYSVSSFEDCHRANFSEVSLIAIKINDPLLWYHSIYEHSKLSIWNYLFRLKKYLFFNKCVINKWHLNHLTTIPRTSKMVSVAS